MMNSSTGNCANCGCHWTVHVNSGVVYKTRQVNKTKDTSDLKAQYDEAT